MKANNNKKTTLGIIIDTDLKIPPATGVSYRLYYLSKQLCKNGMEVKLFICNRNIASKKDEKLLYEKSQLEMHIIPESIFYSPEKLKKIIKNNDIDIIQFEDAVSVLRYKKIFQELEIPICLEMHDVESSLKEMLDYCQDDVKMTNALSSHACKLANKVVCMTPLDHSELIYKIGVNKKKLSIIPNPINLDTFPFLGPHTKAKNIIFIGNMHYWPNQNAVINIIKKIVPEVLKNNPDTNFYFIGMTPSKISKLESNNVIFTDRVNDLNPYLQKTSIALCPVYEGSGMKVKILNYCAAGIPVITTDIGASGYEKVKSLIIENKLSKYPNIISALLSNKDRLKKNGANNRKYIKKYFEVDLLSQKMVKLYRKILQESNGRKNDNFDSIDIPLPLWLGENRIKKINNNNYYIIKNGETIFKKTIT